jgi:hypothetical protein
MNSTIRASLDNDLLTETVRMSTNTLGLVFFSLIKQPSLSIKNTFSRVGKRYFEMILIKFQEYAGLGLRYARMI